MSENLRFCRAHNANEGLQFLSPKKHNLKEKQASIN